jgi:hypothetical protein
MKYTLTAPRNAYVWGYFTINPKESQRTSVVGGCQTFIRTDLK